MTRSIAGTLGRLSLVLATFFCSAAAFAVDVQISGFTDNPDPAVRGGNIAYTITVQNSDADTANNVVVTYPLPASSQFVSASDPAQPGACTFDGQTPGTVTCTYATLLGTLASPTAGPVETITVIVKTTGSSVTTLNSTVTVTTTDADTNLSNNSLSQNTTINNGADLSATMSGSPNPATGGANVTWTISGSNLGPNTSGAVTYSTTLPGVLTYVAAGSGGNGWTCSVAGQVVTCTLAAQAVGAYPNLPIVTKVTGAGGGTVTVSGNITSTVGDPDLTNNSPVASVTLNPGTDLAVTQSAPSPSPAISGSAVTFTLQPSNSGPYPATAGVNVTFPLPTGFTVSTATGSTGWSCASAGSPPTVTCTFAGSLASGASGTLTIAAAAPTVATPTAYNNITATIAPNAGGPADPNAANNTAARNLTVSPDGLDLSVTKSKSPNIVAVGANMTSTIVVTNAGPRTAATGTITVVDALDSTKEQYVSFSGTNWSCVSAVPNVNCTYNAALGIGNASTLTITTLALTSGTITNNATTSYSGTPGDYNSANNAIGASVTATDVNNSPDLQVGLTATTAGGVQTTVEANETQITYTLALTNKVIATPVNAQNVVVTLSIPGRLTTTNVAVSQVLTNTSGNSTATFTCTGTGTGSTGNVVCTQAGGTVLSPGDVMTFTAVANRPLLDVSAVNVTATAVSTSQGDPLPSDNSATVPITIIPIADVELVSKVLAANPVLAGTNATYTITLRNDGPSSAAGVSLADVFTIPGGDNGFTFISVAASNGGVCAGLTAGTSYTSGTPTETCTWSAVVTNTSTRTVTIVVRPNWQAGTAARTLANTATVSTTTAEDSVGGQGTFPDSKALTLNINPAQVDVLINDSDLVDPIGYDPSTPANNDITYDVVETNNGPSLASGTGFTFTMTPPAGKTATFRGDGLSSGVAAANPSGTIPGSLCDSVGTSVTGPSTMTVTCLYAAPGLLANAASQTRYLVFRVGTAPNVGGDTYTTLATVIVNETDTNLSNNTEGETTTVRVRADIGVVKTASVNPAQLRQPFNWTILVSNAGPGDSQTTGLTDTLPTGTVFSGAAPSWTSTSGGSGTCTVAGLSLTCAFGTLPANQSATVTVPVKVATYPSGGTTQNCATATTSEIDPNSANNLSVCGTVAVQISSLAGTVFQDRDRNGANAGTPQTAATEPRISGVTVKLTGTDAYGNAVSLTTTSDVNGAYGFGNLSPAGASGYTITETQPAGYVNGPASPPTPAASGTYAAGGSTGNSTWTAILLAGNTAGVSYDFPEVRQPSLSGFVYIDSNANGTRDAGTDGVVSGATVRLLNAGTLALVATTTTDGTGAYSFTGLDPLTVYTLEEPLPSSPAGLGNGAVNPGLVNGATCASGCTAQANTPVANTDRIASIDLSAGTDGTLFNFGELLQASVSGLVFIDANRNNLLDGSDTGRIAGVTVRLVQGADCTSGTALQTATTAADGTYSFANVLALQSYLVCETQPAGYGNGVELPGTNGATTPGANVIAFTSLSTSGSTGNNFGERVASVAGSVYQDTGGGTPANFNNGVRDSGESGIVNVPVTLSGNDQFGTPVSRSVVTDASGNFSFDGLFPPNGSGYTLTEGAIPAASGTFLQGKDALGTAGGSIAVQDVTSGIVLTAGQQASGYLFGELPQTAVSGTVYIDRNRNNTIDATPTDGRIAGVTLRLVTGADCSSGTTLQTATSANDGSYSFGNVAGGGNYLVCETQPAGYGNGIENPGTGATTPGANVIAIANLASAGSSGNNFGELVASIAGSVYQDYTAATPANTNNGVRDSGEVGIANVPVTLTGHDINGATVNTTLTTDVNGNYTFADLLQSDSSGYTVSEGAIPAASGTFLQGKDAAGTAGGSIAVQDVTSGIALTAGISATGYLFGELPIAPISGTVYVDRNRNGTMEATPTDGRIAGATLTLRSGTTCAGAVLETTSSDASGNYSFSGIAAGGTVTICETQPPGYADGGVNPGTAAASSAANTITITNLPAAGSPGNLFGEQVGSLAGSVYLDYTAATPANNNNGARDTGEPGIANVPVTLTGHDATGASVALSTTTDASGNYSFAGLLQSDASGYTVSEGAIPAASGTFLQGKDAAGTAGGSIAVQDVTSGIALPAGANATGYLFGELPNVSISGAVYVDLNRNGTMEAAPTDGRIANVTLRLLQGANCASGTVLQTTTSAPDGSYAFAGVAGGQNYLICETQPAGYGQGSVNPGTSGTTPAVDTILVTNLPSTGSTGNLFGEQVGSLAGSVYLDYTATTPGNNNNGARDSGEPGIANVPVTLTGHDITGAAVTLSTTTDASGNYSFSGLLQSDGTGYTVSEGAIPAASGTFLQGKDAAGTPAGSIAVQDVTSGIVLPAGANATGYLFGELPSASIAGTVYLDLNRNGTMDPSPTDGRIANVTVRLLQGTSCASGTVLQTTTSAADGSYAFTGVGGGENYLVCETQPAGYAQGTVNPGTSATTPATDTILITNLPSGGSTGNLFGERAGSVSGNVFLDANDDGLRTGDVGIAGVTVTLTGNDASGSPVSRTTTTDTTGAYRFDGLLGAGAGGYTLTEQTAQPVVGGKTTLNGKTTAGSSGGTATAVTTTPSAIASIALAAGADASENNFAEIAPVSLAGVVFVDLNNNGVQNPPGDVGIANVAIVVTGTDDNGAAVTRNLTTGADGSYALVDLRPGTYTVTEPTQPVGTTNGLTVAGSAGGTATGPTVTPSAITGIVLTAPGSAATAYDFAELNNTSAVSGRVWLDADNNGLINGTEAGIAGVTITLTGTDLGGNAVSHTTTTDASGNFSFAGLAPGTYTLGEPTQPTGTLNGKTVAGSAGGTPTAVATTPSAIAGIVIAAGQSAVANNFGELPTASIAGHVISDSNNNGKLDAGESGIANVSLALTGTDDQGTAVNASTTSDANGAYSFANLRPGSYTVTEPTQPPATDNGITTAGTVNGTSTGTATSPATLPSAISAIALPVGGASIGNDFAEIGSSPDVLVTKAAVGARFTVDNVGTYTISVRNGGEVATTAAYRVSDRLPPGLTLAAVPSGTDWTCAGAIGASSFTCTSSDVMAAGASNVNAITATVLVAASAVQSSPAINAVMVDGGGELPARAPSASDLDGFNNTPANLPPCVAGITQNACRTATIVQASASLSGTVWYDTGSAHNVLDGGDQRLAGWQVEVLDASGNIVARATTAADGTYRIVDLLPGVALHVRFRDPASTIVWGYPVNGEAAPGSSGASCNTQQAIASGTASSCAGTGNDPTLTVVLAAGANLPQQSLPVDPSGVIYDSGTRQPVPGAVVTLTPSGSCAGWNPATGLVASPLGGYTINGSAVSMTVGVNGFYQFLLSPAAPASCTFTLTVAPPAGYTFTSVLIPPTAGPYMAAGAPGSSSAVQPQAAAPTGAVGPATTYYLTLTVGSGTANVVNDHIPLDPTAAAGLSLSKTGDKNVAQIGDSVRYTVTVLRSTGATPRQVTIVDRLPAGFTFIAGTAVLDGVTVADPAGKPGPALTFNLGTMPSTGQFVLHYRVRVGVGAQQGDGTNRAIGYGCGVPAGCTAGNGTSPLPGSTATNEARFKVTVSGGVFTTDACFAGKIFVDCNGNHIQDPEEIGIPGVRLVVSDGTTLVSDSEGKYSYCGMSPRSAVIRVDETTLPRGSRLTTSSNRNLGDAGSLWLDLKNGELARADFIEGSCSANVIDQVKARRAQGEVRAVETEKKSLPALKFDSKDKGPKPRTDPPTATTPTESTP